LSSKNIEKATQPLYDGEHMFADEHQLQGGSHRTFYFYTNGLHVKNGTEVPFQEDDSEGWGYLPAALYQAMQN